MKLAINDRVRVTKRAKHYLHRAHYVHKTGRVALVGPRSERDGLIRRSIQPESRLYLIVFDDNRGAEWFRYDELSRLRTASARYGETQHG